MWFGEIIWPAFSALQNGYAALDGVNNIIDRIELREFVIVLGSQRQIHKVPKGIGWELLIKSARFRVVTERASTRSGRSDIIGPVRDRR